MYKQDPNHGVVNFLHDKGKDDDSPPDFGTFKMDEPKDSLYQKYKHAMDDLSKPVKTSFLKSFPIQMLLIGLKRETRSSFTSSIMKFHTHSSTERCQLETEDIIKQSW